MISWWPYLKQNPGTLLGASIVALFIFVALFGPALAPYDPYAIDFAQKLEPASWAHWCGTDELGRDVFSRILYGARPSFLIALLCPFLAAPLGLLVGLISGFFPGIVDTCLMRITDIFLAFPKLILALALVAILGPKFENVILAIALTSWPAYARMCRTEIQIARKADYITGAFLSGISKTRILLVHLPPLCFSPLLIRISLDMGAVILTAATLSFLGLGAPPPTAEWGTMVSSGRDLIFHEWWISVFPGLAIFIVSLGFTLLGNGIRDALDPQNRGHL